MGKEKTLKTFTAYPEDEEYLRLRLESASLSVDPLLRRISRCNLAHCGGGCCYDGIYVSDSTASTLQKIAQDEADYFLGIGLNLPEDVIEIGEFNGEILGPKTATRKHPFSRLVSDFPNHFTDTSCVFLLESGKCGLQLLAKSKGVHPWFYKPLGCWLHPLHLGKPQEIGIDLYSELTDPYILPEYPGYVSVTACGRTEPLGQPALNVLEEELQFISEIVGRDILEELNTKAGQKNEDTIAKVGSALPITIAGAVHGLSLETSHLRRLHLVIHCFSQLMRFMSLIRLSTYAKMAVPMNQRDEDLLLALRRPTLGIWLQVINTLSGNYVKEKDISPIMQIWVSAYSRLKDLESSNCVRGDINRPRQRMRIVDAFVHLRNVLAHGAAPPTLKECKKLLDDYEPMLERMLEAVAPLAELTIHRVVSTTENQAITIILNGWEQPLERKTITIPIDLRDRFLTDRCFAATDNGDWLELDPLLVAPTAEVDVDEYTDPLLTYEGLTRKKVVYLGLSARFETTHNYHLIIDALFANSLEGKQDEVNWLEKIFRQLSHAFVTENIGSKYQPESYISRLDLVTLIEDFVFNMPRAKALLLVGDSGIGKTSFICDQILTILRDKSNRILPIVVSGKDLTFVPQENSMDCHSEGSLGSLGRYLADLFGFKSGNWTSLVEEVTSALSLDRSGSSKIPLIVVDAINEAPRPLSVMQEFDELVGIARRRSDVHCLATTRRVTHQLLVQQLVAAGYNWPRNEKAFFAAPNELGELCISVPLRKLSCDEAKNCYQIYQGLSGEEGAISSATTAFDSLPVDVQDLIRHPLLLRLLMETFDGHSIPSQLAATQLFAAFHEQRLASHQASAAVSIARLMLNHSQTSLEHVHTSDLRLCDYDEECKDNYRIYMDPVEQLVDLGVLQKDDRDRLRFTHQKYLEYLLYFQLKHDNPTDSWLLKRIQECAVGGTGCLEEELGAICLIFIEKWNEGNPVLVSGLFNLILDDRIARVATAIVDEVHRKQSVGISLLEQEVDSTSNIDTLRAAADIFRTIGDRRLHRKVFERLIELETGSVQMVIDRTKYVRLLIMSNETEMASAILRDLDQESGDYSPELNLDIQIENGYLNFVRANNHEALGHYNQCLEALDQMKVTMPDNDRDSRKSEILGGLGCVHHNMESNAAGLQTHTEALTIDRDLDNAPAVAMSLVNVADAQWGCHLCSESLRTYSEAIDVARATHYKDALDMALIGRGIVLWSIGCFDEAERSIQMGLDIADELDYKWDKAYGLIYLSNVQAAKGDLESALSSNHLAITLAIEVGAEYLELLSQAWLSCKEVSLRPDQDKCIGQIGDMIERANKSSMRGPEIILRTVLAMHKVACEKFEDTDVSESLQALLCCIRDVGVLKGPWELLGLQLSSLIGCYRPNLDSLELEDYVDSIIEEKTADLDSRYKEIYLKTRRPFWDFFSTEG